MTPLRLRADWVFPMDAPPLVNGAVLIGADGRIEAVGPDAEVPRPPGAQTRDLGSAALLPGLVNTHTHLELTGLEDQAPEEEFRDWITTIRRLKAARSPEQFLQAARRGLRDCWTAGVTTVADTGDSGAVLQALAESGGSGIVYQEVFGPDPAQLETSLAGLRREVERLRAFATDRARLGVSPHAPYTVSGPLYRRTAEWAAEEGLPVAVHLAESPAEVEFLRSGTGPFAEAWRSRNIPLPESRGTSPVEWLDRHGVLGPRTLCIHTVQLSAGDIGLLARRGAAVAHCPLSNARHRHGAAPLAQLRAAGIRVGIGTDSVASVGRLDLLAELRAAQQLGSLDRLEALALATREGARALGLESEIGTLTPGKQGDVVAVALPGEGFDTAEGAAEGILAGGSEPVLVTVLGGRTVHEGVLRA